MNPEALSELISHIAHDLVAAGEAGSLTEDLIPPVEKFAVMRPKDRSHGDWASNAAMQLAKKAGMKPRDLAQLFAARLQSADGIAAVEVAGPGIMRVLDYNEISGRPRAGRAVRTQQSPVWPDAQP